MRRFGRRVNNHLQFVVLTLVLIISMQFGASSQVYAETVPWKITGTVAPSVSDPTYLNYDLSVVHLVFGFGESGIEEPIQILKVGDFFAEGTVTPFTINTTIEYQPNYNLWWYAFGLHGDVADGTYDGRGWASDNGVMLAINAQEGDNWSDHYWPHEEETIFYEIVNDNPVNLLPLAYDSWHYADGLEVDECSTMFNFCKADYNGEICFTTEIVPEPMTMLFLASGSVLMLRKRTNGK